MVTVAVATGFDPEILHGGSLDGGETGAGSFDIDILPRLEVSRDLELVWRRSALPIDSDGSRTWDYASDGHSACWRREPAQGQKGGEDGGEFPFANSKAKDRDVRDQSETGSRDVLRGNYGFHVSCRALKSIHCPYFNHLLL